MVAQERVFLILSSKLCTKELSLEYGDIPRSFLPVGNKRLYEIQIKNLRKYKKDAKIFISLPLNFTLPNYDKNRLKALKVGVVYISQTLEVGEAIYEFVTKASPATDVSILYASRYIKNIDIKAQDICYVNNLDLGDKKNLCGYFNFSDIWLFCKILKISNFDLLNALSEYNKKIKLKYLLSAKLYDFASLVNYYKSKTIISTSRSFNILKFQNLVVTKKSLNKKKLAAEALWYESVPSAIKGHVPDFLGAKLDKNGEIFKYKTQYLHMSSLSELMVFGDLHISRWTEIYSAIFSFLQKTYKIKAKIDFDPKSFYLNKTLKRLEKFSYISGFDIKKSLYINDCQSPSLFDIAHISYDFIPSPRKDYLCFSHGDLCFSNILYDFKSKTIRVIDPRALDENDNFSIYSDIRYDLAKLAHSLVGRYDLIMSSMYNTKINKDRIYIEFSKEIDDSLVGLFWDNLEKFIPGLKSEIYAIMIHLFLSMLPLHYDSSQKQRALLANALSLYRNFCKNFINI